MLYLYQRRCSAARIITEGGKVMSDKVIHDLAVAYAQVKLMRHQQEAPEDDGLDSELRFFLKSYYYALNNLPDEDKDLDEHF